MQSFLISLNHPVLNRWILSQHILERGKVMQIVDRAEHEKAKERINRKTLKEVESAENPFTATDVVYALNPIEACALIDRVFPIMAAIIIGALKIKAEKDDAHAREIIDRAQALEIRGTKGICHERDALFKLTGVLLA